MSTEMDDRLEERMVTFSVEYHGRLVVIENVPARVDPVTGEQFFSPDTVERLQAIVWNDREPDHADQTAVFQFAA